MQPGILHRERGETVQAIDSYRRAIRARPGDPRAYFLLGAMYVASPTVLGPRLGAAALLAFTLAGQMLAALIVDHYGIIGFPQSPLTPSRVLGAALLVAGVLLIMRR